MRAIGGRPGFGSIGSLTFHGRTNPSSQKHILGTSLETQAQVDETELLFFSSFVYALLFDLYQYLSVAVRRYASSTYSGGVLPFARKIGARVLISIEIAF